VQAWCVAVGVTWVVTSGAVHAAAAGPQQAGQGTGAAAAPPSGVRDPVVDPDRMSPRDVQRLFDAYVAMQAQERLQLNDAQYTQFLPRLKALLDLRRTQLAGRQRMLGELARASGPGGRDDEGQLRAKLSQLRAADEQAAAALRGAYDAIDQILDVRQQARFRVFEDQIERRKVELLMRARQNIRNRRAVRP
jgi:hypothetical protein